MRQSEKEKATRISNIRSICRVTCNANIQNVLVLIHIHKINQHNVGLVLIEMIFNPHTHTSLLTILNPSSTYIDHHCDLLVVAEITLSDAFGLQYKIFTTIAFFFTTIAFDSMISIDTD